MQKLTEKGCREGEEREKVPISIPLLDHVNSKKHSLCTIGRIKDHGKWMVANGQNSACQLKESYIRQEIDKIRGGSSHADDLLFLNVK